MGLRAVERTWYAESETAIVSAIDLFVGLITGYLQCLILAVVVVIGLYAALHQAGMCIF